jgi:Flp pilus assembly protein TadG
VEWALVTPVLGLLLMLIVQYSMWAFADHAAEAAANAGVQAARAYQPEGTLDTGRQDATTVLRQLAGSSLTDYTVTSSRTPTTVTITITGRAVAVVPGLQMPIRVSVTAPREVLGTT